MIGVTIAHCKARPERQRTLRRLLESLPPVWQKHVEDAPGEPHEWSLKQWEGGLALGTPYVLCLNDDMVLCEGFAEVLGQVLEALPAHLIHLYNHHELAKQAQLRQLRWITSVDGLFGNAYILPRDGLQDFLTWRASAPVGGFVERCSEDNLLNLWAMARGLLWWHTVPALCDHDASIPSCYGNDGNVGRTASVPPWKKMPRDGWDSDALHVGRYYKGSHYYLVTKMREPLLDRYFAMAGEPEFR